MICAAFSWGEWGADGSPRRMRPIHWQMSFQTVSHPALMAAGPIVCLGKTVLWIRMADMKPIPVSSARAIDHVHDVLDVDGVDVSDDPVNQG